VSSLRALPDVDFEAMSAEDMLRWSYEEFGERLCLTCSWQKQSSVLVHMISEPRLPVDSSSSTRNSSSERRTRPATCWFERYGLTLIRPEVITVAEQHRREGPNLWERDPDRCCHIRKVEPLISRARPV
jgi:phosphoadenosine phosphosulfate reductase